MKASDSTLFDQAQRKLDQSMASADTADIVASRTYARHTARGALRLLPGGVDHDPRDVRIGMLRDMSRGGAGVLVCEPIDRSTMLQVQFEVAAAPLASITAVCRHCREVIDGVYVAGLAFGLDASILVSQGISPSAIVQGDGEEDQITGPGEFIDPKALIGDEAA